MCTLVGSTGKGLGNETIHIIAENASFKVSIAHLAFVLCGVFLRGGHGNTSIVFCWFYDLDCDFSNRSYATPAQ